MKNILLLLVLFISFSLSSQELEKIKDINIKIKSDKINASQAPINSSKTILYKTQKICNPTSEMKALLILEGKIISQKKLKAIKSKNIQSMNVLKGKKAIAKYGNKGKNGVIKITLIKKNEKKDF